MLRISQDVTIVSVRYRTQVVEGAVRYQVEAVFSLQNMATARVIWSFADAQVARDATTRLKAWQLKGTLCTLIDKGTEVAVVDDRALIERWAA